MSKRSLGLLGLLLAGMFVFVACADPAQPTATPQTFNPTPAGGAAPTATPSHDDGGAEPTAAPSGPDADAGQTVFATNCAACHNTNDQTLVGPGLAGVGTAAESRVSGQSADEYLTTSIREPGAFLVEGFGPIMPALPLSDSDVANVVAYLKTLQ